MRCVGSILRSLPAGARGSWWESLSILWHGKHDIGVLYRFSFGVHLAFFFVHFSIPAFSFSSVPREGVKAASQPPRSQWQSWSWDRLGNGHLATGHQVSPAQHRSGQGQPSQPLEPDTACHLRPVIANISMFTDLQDTEVRTVLCRDNSIHCLSDPAMDLLIFPVQEEKCLGFFQGSYGTGKVICTVELMWCGARKNLLSL